MSNFWTSQTDEANESIDALDEPTSRQAFEITRLFGFRALIAALVKRIRAIEDGGGASLPSWWTVDSTPDAENVAFDGDVLVIAPAFPASGVEALVIKRDGETFRAHVLTSDGIYELTGQGGDAARLTIRQQGSPVAGLIARAHNDSSSDLRLYDSNGDPVHSLQVAANGAGLLGFFGTAAAAQPEIPADPTPQDVVDALLALGLTTQAS